MQTFSVGNSMQLMDYSSKSKWNFEGKFGMLIILENQRKLFSPKYSSSSNNLDMDILNAIFNNLFFTYRYDTFIVSNLVFRLGVISV